MEKTEQLSIPTVVFFLSYSFSALAQNSFVTAPSITQPLILPAYDVGQIKVVPVVTGLANPWAMAFRDNGDILVTERYTGKLRLIRHGKLEDRDIPGVPEVYSAVFRAGLMAVAVHPDDDQIVYLTYTKAIVHEGEPNQAVTLVRARLVEDNLENLEEIFIAHGVDSAIAASALLFAPDGKLMMTVGGSYVFSSTGEYAQDPAVHYGKLLRLNADGSAPDDNPFAGSGEFLPEVYSVGHRNQLGMTVHPQTGQLWASENGPQGGDEANISLNGRAIYLLGL